MPTIIQSPGVFFGYPSKGDHGRCGKSPVAIVHHTMQGWLGYYLQIVKGQTSIENAATFSLAIDGTIRQHVALSDAAWCNGLDWSAGGLDYHRSDKSLAWLQEAYRARVSPNCYTISIEIEGLSGRPLTPAQFASLVALDTYLMARYPAITPDRQHLVGHYQIDGVNKGGCPGPAFPWTRLMAALAPITHGPNIPANPTGGTDMTAAEQAQIKTWTGEIAAALESYGKGMDQFELLYGQTAWAKARRAEKDLIWDRALTKLRTLAGLQ